VFTAAVVVAFFLLILSRTTLDQSAFQVRDLEQQIVLEEQRYWELRVEVARLQAPDRIVGAAEELGLVYPDRVDTVQVRATPRPSSSLEDRWAEIKALLSAHP
jgi:cell division protein FtsL